MLARAFLPPFLIFAVFLAMGIYDDHQSAVEDARYVANLQETSGKGTGEVAGFEFMLAWLGLIVTIPVHLTALAIAMKNGVFVAKVYLIVILCTLPIGLFIPLLLLLLVPMPLVALGVEAVLKRVAGRESLQVQDFVKFRKARLHLAPRP